MQICTFEDISDYINNHQELKAITGECRNCPLLKKCDEAHHKERIDALLKLDVSQSRFPWILKIIQQNSFLLKLIPKFVFMLWDKYKKYPLGCPSVGVAENIDEIRKVYNLLTNEESREVYAAIVMYRLTFDHQFLDSVASEGPEYFDVFHGLDEKTIVIDCGAYIGDTLTEYIKCNEIPQYYLCYEPDLQSASQLKALVSEKRYDDFVCVRECGVDKKNALKCFENGMGLSSHFSDGTNEGNANKVYTVSIDEDIVSMRELSSVSVIKMDVEGFEMGAILGAERTIASYGPKLAICIYHKPFDLWEIPLQICKIHEYKNWVVKHYDRINYTDSILYAFD